MATSDVDIVNQALTRLGQEPITTLTESSRAARAASRVYDHVRRETLADHPWNCAMKRTALAASATEPEWGYDYAYPLPSDFLRLIRTDDMDDEFRIEGRSILSNANTMQIVYLYDITNVQEMDYPFQSAFAARLAAQLAVPLTGDKALKQQMMQEYEIVLNNARFVDSQQSPIDRIELSTLIAARHGATDQPFRPIEAAE